MRRPREGRDTEELVASLDPADLAHLLSGDEHRVPGLVRMGLLGYNRRPIVAGHDPRRGIPGVRFTDGPRGVVMGRSTCFPVAIARGATFDPALEERVGDAIGVEARAQGADLFAGVCVNVVRHPAWGRTQESFGEDPHHLGVMGTALIRGARRHVMTCVKHFACNSIENSRFRVDVQIDERALREVYLPHFRRCVDAGAAAVMTAYNKVNGEWCGQHRRLLTEVLKGEWDFGGFVMSDFVWGVRDGAASVANGLDLEMPFRHRVAKELPRAIADGRVPEKRASDAARRLIGTQLRFAAVGEPERYRADAVACPEHRALAREVATRSMVLLKNDDVDGSPLLPVDPSPSRNLTVLGRLATRANLGDHGSSRVRPPHVVTPLDGLRAAAGPDTTVLHDDGRDLATATRIASAADLVVCVVGCGHRDEGEHVFRFLPGGDRRSLGLHEHDRLLVEAAAAGNPRTLVVMVGGSAILTAPWDARVPAVLHAWYPGMEGGHALADVVFGATEPGGRLPLHVPRTDDQLPHFDPDADTIVYDRYHGYRLADRDGHEPSWWFGHGLGYTTFEHGEPEITPPVARPDGTVTVHHRLANTGRRRGDEVVQAYVGPPGGAADRARRELRAFRRVTLEPGESRTVGLSIPVADLAWYDPDAAAWSVESGDYTVWVGPSADPARLRSIGFRVGESG